MSDKMTNAKDKKTIGWDYAPRRPAKIWEVRLQNPANIHQPKARRKKSRAKTAPPVNPESPADHSGKPANRRTRQVRFQQPAMNSLLHANTMIL